MKSFADIGICSQLIERIAERSIREPTPVQERIIPLLLEGRDVAFRSATGTGKTFAYLLPILQTVSAGRVAGQRGPFVVIVAPTYELCAQIKIETEFLGKVFAPELRAVLLTGDANLTRQIDRIKDDKPEVVVGTAARIGQIARMGKLKLGAVRFLVLDEVDRLLAEELRASVEALARELPQERISVACSATMTRKAREQVAAFMRDTAAREELEDEEVLRTKIEHWAFFSEGRKKIAYLRSFLAAAKPEKTLIFTDRNGQVGNILGQLVHHGANARCLYGDMNKVDRKKAIDDFRSGRATVLVTSDLAARGLDIDRVSHVVEMDVPDNAEAYAHRAGRTGRAGKSGVMVTIGDEVDLPRLAALEKRLKIVVVPKELYGGKVRPVEAVEEDAVAAEIPEIADRGPSPGDRRMPRKKPPKHPRG